MWPHRVILAVNNTWYTNYLNSSLKINNTRYKPTNYHNSWNSFNFILHSDNCRIKFKGIVFFSWYILHCINLITQLPAMGCSRHIGQGVTSWPKTRYNWVKTVLNLYHDSWKLDGSQHFMQNFPLLIYVHVSDLQRHIQSILWHPSLPEHQGPRSVWSSHHHPSQQTGN